MSRWPALIRLTLSLCLILNGAGTGVAAHAGVVHASDSTDAPSAVHPTHTSSDTKAPCHGTDAPPTEHENEGGTSTEDGPALPDCCRLAGCTGACLQHSPAAVVLWLPVAVVTPTGVAAANKTTYPAPQLPPLIRPPDA
jgi:hypothetical protein